MVMIPFHNVQIGFSNQKSFALKNHILLSLFQHFPSVATNSNSVMKSLLKLTLVHQLTEARQGARLPLSSTFGGSVVRVGHRQSPYSLVATGTLGWFVPKHMVLYRTFLLYNTPHSLRSFLTLHLRALAYTRTSMDATWGSVSCPRILWQCMPKRYRLVEVNLWLLQCATGAARD